MSARVGFGFSTFIYCGVDLTFIVHNCLYCGLKFTVFFFFIFFFYWISRLKLLKGSKKNKGEVLTYVRGRYWISGALCPIGTVMIS